MIENYSSRSPRSWSVSKSSTGRSRRSYTQIADRNKISVLNNKWITDNEPSMRDADAIWQLTYDFDSLATKRVFHSQLFNPPVIKRQTVQIPREEIWARLNELHRDAEAEGLLISSESEAAFWSFINEFQITVRPKITLRANGNLRALWQDNARQIGLQFMGGLHVGYVVLSDSVHQDGGQHYGASEFHPLVDVVTALGLRYLWY